ncbi:MAG: TonB-dependent receptor [Haliscomenobacteraceae bacterium CHB4]|nr:Fe(3+) dicitrate transport protein FecA [Saprospiraceae bacterium]MCE7921765.1 TonB-dependent receptor [Haliscomenobacteraceae bacterium CHB4]
MTDGQQCEILKFGRLSRFLRPGKFEWAYPRSRLRNFKSFVNVTLLVAIGSQINISAQTPDSLPRRLPIDSVVQNLKEVVVSGHSDHAFASAHLRGVENFGIYSGKKTEVVTLAEVTANAATNNPRQIYGRVTGLNIWESDGAGLQLGIGGRGLSPNRTANFNTRQNGYDISADALGYPESYYTPPTEALDRIEIVRGAASLQYGTQFGGLLNFRFKRGPEDRKIAVTTRQTAGSWGFFGTFNSIGGTVLNGKLNYYGYFQYKRGDGYRPNSAFDYRCAYASADFRASQKLSLRLDLTHMDYLAHQPGGLTDKMFGDDPRQSVRARNWFQVDWNMAAVTLNYNFSDKTRLDVRNFGLLARRQSLGNLERINVADFGQNRTLIDGQFKNFGQETRLLHRYELRGLPQTLLAGYRLYSGHSTAKQGDGTAGSDADFRFINPENLENSDYEFPNQNQAVFLENVFNLSPKWSLTPGLRYERIVTRSEGYYTRRVLDAAGNVIVQNKINDKQERKRDFIIGGLGAAFKARESLEMYANVSQNYRAINFTDLRIVNPNFTVDSNLQDERGFTADLGIRGSKAGFFTYEVTAFYIAYNGKIGQILRADQPPLYNDYRFRSNISDARNIGLEAFGEVDVLRFFSPGNPRARLTLFLNAAVVDARYVNTDDASVRDKKVEMAPPLMLRSGLSFQRGPWRAAFQYACTGKHFSDATNAERTATAVEGAIPAYGVADVTASWTWRWLTLEASCNNLFDAAYFTRRAESYPGPGIIPSDGRGIYVTLGGKF